MKRHLFISLLASLSSLALTALGQQWTSLTPLPDGYSEHALVYANGYLYNIGGVGKNGEPDGTNVFYSQVYSNGTIGPWNRTTSLPESVFDSAGVADNGFVYVIAGNHLNATLGDFTTNIVYYAKINSDGTLSAWQTANPLPQSVFWHSAGVWNHTIYSVGGADVYGQPVSNVYSAKIQSDGSLSVWISQSSIPDSRLAQAQAIDGMIYVIGGIGEKVTNGVYYCKINADGSLGGWNSTTSYPQKVVNFGAVAGAGCVFGVGGFNGNAAINNFYGVAVSGDGSLGTWQTGTSLPQSLYYFAVAVNDSYLFLSGGGNDAITSSAVYSMPLPSPPASPVLTSQNITNQTFQLQLTSTTNTGFGILASPDLTSWTNIGWGFTDTNGLLLFQDTNAASFPQRFYRAYWPLP